ncbi:MAG: ABC-2 transporter permease [Candidatus Lokiarchaeota archaeon]|nr:ABC-2 transporter permease [Candidatus Lokiarchaeota archaeon]
MGMKQILAIVKKNMQSLVKDRRTFALLIIMPIILMMFFGYGFNQDIKNIPIKVVNLDEGGPGIPPLINDTTFSSMGIQFLQEDDRVQVSQLSPVNFSLSDEESKIYGGNDYFALIVFPVNFTEDLPKTNSTINLIVAIDGSQVQIAGSIKATIIEMINYISNSITVNKTRLLLNFDYVAGNPNLKPIDTLAPGILSFAILLFMILNVTGGFTKEKISGTINRVLVTKTTKSDLLLGYMLGNSVIALVQSSLLLIIGAFLFNLYIVGNLLLLYFILFIYSLSCIGVSILAASAAKTELQAFQFIPIILIPFMFFSGFIFPVQSFPDVLQWVAKAIPMTYSIDISRAIMINGLGFGSFLNEFLILIGLTIMFLSLAILIFRPKK